MQTLCKYWNVYISLVNNEIVTTQCSLEKYYCPQRKVIIFGILMVLRFAVWCCNVTTLLFYDAPIAKNDVLFVEMFFVPQTFREVKEKLPISWHGMACFNILHQSGSVPRQSEQWQFLPKWECGPDWVFSDVFISVEDNLRSSTHYERCRANIRGRNTTPVHCPATLLLP